MRKKIFKNKTAQGGRVSNKPMTAQEDELTLGLMVEGEEIAQTMTEALLSVEPNEKGVAVIIYALSKLNVSTRKMLESIGLKPKPLMRQMEQMWDEQIEF